MSDAIFEKLWPSILGEKVLGIDNERFAKSWALNGWMAAVRFIVDATQITSAPYCWAVRHKSSPDIWETFPAEKYAREDLKRAIKNESIVGPEEEWEVFPLYHGPIQEKVTHE